MAQDPNIIVNVQIPQEDLNKMTAQISESLLKGLKDFNSKAEGAGGNSAFKNIGDQAKHASDSVISLKAAIDANEAALEKHRAELQNNGISLVEVEKKTASYQQALTGEIVTHQQLQKMLAVEDKDYNKINSTIAQLTRSTDTLSKTMALADPEKIGTLAKYQKADAVFKNLSFSIGLVGYGMENLGRRFTGFAEILFNFLKTSAEATESLERMQNALKAEGKSPEEADRIEERLRKIADLPTGKLKDVATAYRQIVDTGKLSSEDSLSLIEGVTKAAGRAGKPGGAASAIEVIQRALVGDANPFANKRSLGTLESELGPEFAAAMDKAFGGVDLKNFNKVGGVGVIQALIPELMKLEPPAAATADKINRIENSFTKIQQLLEIILGPSLDRGLALMQSLETTVKGIVAEFEKLPEDKKNFISNLVGIIPAAILGLGGLLSVLGVLTVSAAVLGRTFNLLSQGLVKFGMMQATETTETLAQTRATDALTAALYRQIAAQEAASAGSAASAEMLAAGGTVGGPALLRNAKGQVMGREASSIVAGREAEISTLAAAEALAPEGGAVAAGGAAGLAAVAVPLAAVVGLIAAYTLNLGSARDVINDTFGKLVDSTKKLYDNIQKLGGSDGFQHLTDAVKLLANTVGAVLGGALAASLQQLTEIIDAINNIGNISSWGNIFHALFGWADSFGKIVGAAIVDGLATALEHMPGGSSFAEGLHNQANVARGSLGQFGYAKAYNSGEVYGPETPGASTGDNLSAATQKAAAFNKELLQSRELLANMDMSSQKFVTSFANMQLSIDRSRNQADLTSASNAAKVQLDETSKIDPEQALKDLPGVAAKLLQAAKTKINDEFKTAAADIKQQTTQAMDSLFQTLGSPDVSNIHTIKDSDNDIFQRLFDSSKVVADYIAQGGTNLNKITELNDKYKNLKLEPLIDPLGLTKEGREVLAEIQQRKAEFQTAVTSYGSTIEKYVKDTDAAKSANDSFIATEEEKNKAIIRHNKALEEARPLQIELTKLEADQRNLQAEGDKELDPAKITANQARAVTLYDNIESLKKQIADLTGEKKGSSEKIQSTTQQALDNIKDSAKQSEDTTKTWLNAVQQLNQIISQGLGALTQYRAQLDAINESRAAMGLSPNVTGFGASAIGQGAAQQLDPLLEQARKFDNILGKGENATVNRLEILVNALRTGAALSQGDISSLRGLAVTTGANLLTGQGSVLTQEKAVEAARLAKNLPGQSEAGQAASTVAYQKALQYLAVLQEKTAVYANELRIVQGLLDGNTQIINTEIKSQEEQNKADLINLGILQDRLSLEKQLLDIQQSNRNNPSNPNYNPADIAGADKNIDAQIANQKALVQAQADITQKQYDDKILALEVQKKQGANVDAEIQNYTTLKTVLAQVTSARLDALDLDKSTSKIKAFGDALNNLGGNAQSQIIFKLTEALHALATGLDVNGNKIQVGAVKLQGVGDLLKGSVKTAFIGFFTGLSTAFGEWLAGTDSFLGGLSKFVGSLLFQLGSTIVQMTQAAVATAAIGAYTTAAAIPGIGIFVAAARAAQAAASTEATLAPFTAIGAGLMVAGTLMGGNGSGAASSSTNSANAANASTGATGATFDPNTDPKTMYQKDQLTTIILDIRSDDNLIIKSMIKAVNSNGRLTKLIGNKALGFG